MDNDFDTIWLRIKTETGLKSLSDLGRIIGKKQPTISASKAKKEFPPGWAYLVAKKFDLTTEWIMTGEGPKKIDDFYASKLDFSILEDINIWMNEITEHEPYRKQWFRAQFEDAFPAFKEWANEKRR